MKEKQTKTKSGLSIWKAILILVAIVVIISISMFAYAKYIAQINGQATAQIATWKFKVTDGEHQDDIIIDLSETLTKVNNKVAGGYVAPRNRRCI